MAKTRLIERVAAFETSGQERFVSSLPTFIILLSQL
jgi:hypothetical protein